MNQNKTINIELNMPDSVLTILSNIDTQLSKIKDSTNRTKDAFSRLGSSSYAFTSIIKAIGLVSSATVKASKFLIGLDAANKKVVASTKLLTAGKLKASVAAKQMTFAASAQTEIYSVMTKKMKAAAAAKWLFNVAIKANPIGAFIALVVGAIAAVGGLIAIFTCASREAREHERAIAELSDQYGVSTDVIESDMESMGTTCTDTWRAVNDAAQEAASVFGGCADEIRAEIAELVDYYGCYELAIESWEATQMEALREVASQWGECAYNVRKALDDMTLDEWVSQQEQALEKLSDEWNMSTSDIQRELEEQGITMDEWALQQETTLTNVAQEWGLCTETARHYMNEMGMSADEWAAHMGQAWEDFNEDVARNVDRITNNFELIPSTLEQSSEEMREIMLANIATTQDWRENLSEIASRVGPDMLRWLEAQGPQFNETIESMLECDNELLQWVMILDQMTALGVQEAIDNVDCPMIQNAFESRMGLTGQAIASNTAIGDGQEAMLNTAGARAVGIASDCGHDVGNSFITGATSADYAVVPNTIEQAISAGQPGMVQPVEKAVTTMVNTFQNGMTSLNSSAVGAFSKIGAAMSGGMSNVSTVTASGLNTIQKSFTTGMNNVVTTVRTNLSDIKNQFSQLSSRLQSSGSQAVSTLRSTANNMVSAMNNVDSRFRSIGQDVMNGLHGGILSREASLMATARRIADNIARTIRQALAIRSPSRVMREQIGRFIPEGIAAGIDKYADAAIDSVYELGNDLINLNLPSIESMIGLEPNLRLAGLSGNTTNVMNDNYSVYEGNLAFDSNHLWQGLKPFDATVETGIVH